MTNRAPKNEVTVKQLKNALRTVALYLQGEPVTGSNGVTGLDGEKHSLAYIQDQMLNGICWKAQREITKLETETLPKAADALGWLVRKYGAPHSVDERIENKKAWIRTLEDQLFTLKELLGVAEEVYFEATDKVYGKSSPSKPADANADPESLAMMRKYSRNKSTANDTRNSPGIEDDVRDTAQH
jgi:hypothetical protein